METIAISRLGRSLLYPETRCIKAVVTLIWPFSSSTQSCALLLAEPDFRLRDKRGQVLVRFHNRSAAALARTRIGSGDEVVLNLEGVQWLDADPGVITPGRSVDTELLFKRKLVCQIIRDGQELANIEVEDDAVSERSRSHTPSTPTGHRFIYANPRLSELNDLSTLASSAFHKRARVSGGLLVDSPYDPFVAKDGEPIRKKARHSWGNEARWTVESDVPSPTKENMTTDWIQDEDLLSPRKGSRRSTPVEESQSPISQLSPITVRPTEIYTHELRSQYTQDLMNQVSGDTEEDTDMEDVQASAVPDRMIRERSYESPLRQSFSVFRDATFAGTSEGAALPMVFETDNPPEFPELPETASLHEEEEAFFNLPSSDSIEALGSVEIDTRFGALGGEVPYMPFERTSSLARELLESDEGDSKEIEEHAHRAGGLRRRSQEEEQLQREEPGVARVEGDESKSQEKAMEAFGNEAPVRESVDLADFQSYDIFFKGDGERHTQLQEPEEMESLARQSLEPVANIDPDLQSYEIPTTVMAPPSLPMIQTSNFDLDSVASMVPPLPSRPRSPKTPDLRPQQSAALPLPSPFPGDNLATSYKDTDISDWQPSQGFTVPLRKVLPGFGFGFGFESDGLDRRYSTEVNDPDVDEYTTTQISTRAGSNEQIVHEEQPALTRKSEVPKSKTGSEEDLELALPVEKMPEDELAIDSLSSNFPPPESLMNKDSESINAQIGSIAKQDVALESSARAMQTSITEEQAISAQRPAEWTSDELVGDETADTEIPENERADADSADVKMVDNDEMDDANRFESKYPDLPLVGSVLGHASRARTSEVDQSRPAFHLQAIRILSPDGVVAANARSEQPAHQESDMEPHDDVGASSQIGDFGDDRGRQEDQRRQQHSGMGDEDGYIENGKRVEHDYEDDEDEDEDDSEDGGGAMVDSNRRFGPPLSTSTEPSKAVGEVIILLSDSDNGYDNVSSEEDSDLESVDGDEEDARASRAAFISDEVREGSEEYEEEEPESEEDEENEDKESMESSGSQDEDDPHQASRTLDLEPSGSQYIPSFDGGDDSPPPSSSESAPISGNRLASSISTSNTLASNLAQSTAVHTKNRIPPLTAPLPHQRETVVIELGSDSESERNTSPSTAPLPIIDQETTTKVEVTDTYESYYTDDQLMEDYVPTDVVDNYPPSRDGPIKDQHSDYSENEQKHSLSLEQKMPALPLASLTSKQRPAVTFAPRVSRRRALEGSQLTTQLEHQSSQPLASSQDAAKRPRLVIQDSFEDMVHSDGSVTTAPPSSRGHDSNATTDVENYSQVTQVHVGTDLPPPDFEEHNAQVPSSPPVEISDSYPEYYGSHPDAPSEATQPKRLSRRQISRPQQSMAESTLATPDASQYTQSPRSVFLRERENTIPSAPKLKQGTPTSSSHARQSYAPQQSDQEDLGNHSKSNQKVEKAVSRAERETSSAEQSTKDASEALAAKLDKLKYADSKTLSGESEKLSEKIKEATFGSSTNLNTWSTPLKTKYTYQDAPDASYEPVSKLDSWLSPRKPKSEYQPSSPPQSPEAEPMTQSQTLREDRFDSEGVEFDEKDDMLSSQFDSGNSKILTSPTVKHPNLMVQSLKDEMRAEEDDYPSSQLSDFRFSQGQPSQTKGLNTSLGYYTPLCNLMTKVSTQVSQFADDLADVIAVVTKSSTRPLKAESGPKDYVTEFLISDEDFWPHKVSVKIYRPWKGALPVLKDGDAILLRGFNVLPTKKGVGLYMRSNESSSWCAWNFNLKDEENDLSFSDDPAPVWSQKIKEGKEIVLEDREVCTAAEAQRGDEERDYVRRLRDWWANKE